AGYLGIDRGMVLDSFKKAVTDRQEKHFTMPRVTLRQHDERILLNALLGPRQNAASIADELRGVLVLATLASRQVFQTMFTMLDAGESLSFESVHARLNEADQNLLAAGVLAEDIEVSEEELATAMASIRRAEEEFRRTELRRRIKESERSGDLNAAF